MDWPPAIYLAIRLCTVGEMEEVCMDATYARPFITIAGCYSMIPQIPIPDGWEIRMAACKAKEETI